MSASRSELYVLGISASSLRGGAYALILAEQNGPRRIPLVIGAAEAQSIAIAMEGITVPRPMTHDLFISFAKAYGVRIIEVFIDHFENGIFSSQITFTDPTGRTVVMDARSSDAIALAVRENAPIFTTEDILVRTGFVIDDNVIMPVSEMSSEPELHDTPVEEPQPSFNPDECSDEELLSRLDELIRAEDYEEAERISAILSRRGANKSDK